MSISEFSIRQRLVGKTQHTYLIAEVGLAHEGSLGMAMAYVDALARAGVDAVKFQTHIGPAEGTPREEFRVPVFPQDASRADYWGRTSFSLPEWKLLAKFTHDKGITFLSSPFSDQAVDWLLACHVAAWKVASGEVSNIPLLAKLAATGLPILISSGMSSWSELQRAVQVVQQASCPFGLFQCTSAYPCPPEQWGLNLLSQLEERFECPVGLSDHSASLAPGIAAVAMGASLLEFHVTFHPEMFGPDVPASLTVDQVHTLVQSIRQLDRALAAPVDKDEVAREAQPMRRLFTKSIVAACDVPAGTVLSDRHVAYKKPGDGLLASQFQSVLGKTTRVDLKTDQQITLSDLL